MAMQQTFFGRAKSIAGAALVGLGIFMVHGNLDRAATQWSHLLSTPPWGARSTSHRHSGSPARSAGLCRRSPAVSAGFPSTHLLVVLAAAARHSRNGIVAGYLHGGCQCPSQEGLWTCRSDGQPARKVYDQSTLRRSA